MIIRRFKFSDKRKSIDKASISPYLSDVFSKLGYTTEAAQASLIFLLSVKGIVIPDGFSSHLEALDFLLYESQAKLRRRQERWLLPRVTTESKVNPLKIFGAVNCITLAQLDPAWQHLNKPYVAVIPGALESCVRLRIDAMLQAISQNQLAPQAVFFITGYRALLDDECQYLDLAERTEAQMIQALWHEYTLEHPACQAYPVYTSIASMRKGQQRANTQDTIMAAASHPILNQYHHFKVFIEPPFVCRFQHLFSQLKGEWSCYAIERHLNQIPLALFFDEIARMIYVQAEDLRAYLGHIDAHQHQYALADEI